MRLASKTFLVTLGVLSPPISPRTELSGTMDCARPYFSQQITVDDRPGHTMGLTQRTCTWSKPLMIEGVSSLESVLSLFSDRTGDNDRERGYGTTAMKSGDRFFMHYASVPSNADGHRSGGAFAISGGTGKLSDLYGSGAVSLTQSQDGALTIRIEGHYTR